MALKTAHRGSLVSISQLKGHENIGSQEIKKNEVLKDAKGLNLCYPNCNNIQYCNIVKIYRKVSAFIKQMKRDNAT